MSFVSDPYFELNILIENFAKNFGVPNANYFFRTNKIKPSKEEYRKKVVEFMRHYEYTLSVLSNTPNYSALRNFVNQNLQKMIELVLTGNDKEVEKRYTYFIMNEP